MLVLLPIKIKIIEHVLKRYVLHHFDTRCSFVYIPHNMVWCLLLSKPTLVFKFRFENAFYSVCPSAEGNRKNKKHGCRFYSYIMFFSTDYSSIKHYYTVLHSNQLLTSGAKGQSCFIERDLYF